MRPGSGVGGRAATATLPGVLRLIGNIIWFFIAGLPLALAYLVFGVIACIFIVTIPFGVASFRLAGYALWPFGRTLVTRPEVGTATTIANVIWFLVAGFWLALAHLGLGIGLCLTLIGIPWGIQAFKMAGAALFPLGKEIVSVDHLAVATTPAGERYGL